MICGLDPQFLARPLAHRGLHTDKAGILENSRSAFAAAIEKGYGIELDLQLSADGQAMVFHDDTLDRMTSHQGPVRNHTAKNLERMALKQSDDCILPLAALLQQVSGSVPLLIELKDQTGDLSSSNGDLERATAKALQHYKGAVAVMSFNPFSVLEMQRQAPQIARGLTTEVFTKEEWPKISKDKRLNLTNMSDFEKCGASFISHHHEDLESAPVRALKAKGIPILCWTIETKAQQHAARQLADNFTFEGFQPATSY